MEEKNGQEIGVISQLNGQLKLESRSTVKTKMMEYFSSASTILSSFLRQLRYATIWIPVKTTLFVTNTIRTSGVWQNLH